MKKFFLMVFCIMFGLFISGCSSGSTKQTNTDAMRQTEKSSTSSENQDEVSRQIFAMDTYMTVTAYGSAAQEAVDKAANEIERLDALLSTGDELSEIAQINQNGGGTLSSDTSYLVERSMELYEDTDGAFYITIYPIMEAWGFTSGNYTIPSEETLQSLLSLTDSSQIKFNKETSTISFEKEGMKIDLGGIAKGYTSARIMDIYRECGIESGIVNLGGNVQVFGTKEDGSQWRVAIQSPEEDGSYLGVLSTQDRAVITSGGYERYFEEDGNTYHHIIDPSTGHPAENGLISVTIISADGTLADGLSTSLFVMGKDKAVEYWNAHSDEFDMILLTEEKTLYVTEGIASQFRSELEFQIIEKGE